MTNLYITLYAEADPKRQKELAQCLLKNHDCKDIDRIFILAERADNFEYLPNVSHLPDRKFIVLPVTERPTFLTFFRAINYITGPEDINIIANSDIYFEEIPRLPNSDQCFALTRYELDGPVPRFLNRSDSQDAYIFRGSVRIPAYCGFALGRPGCDNRISRELSVTGYDVSNPSLTIKCYHVHAGQKSYDNATKRVPPPYLRLNPIAI